jgi:hypothetical protein
MSDIIFVDPKHWLSVFGFHTTGQVYVNEKDGLARSGFHVMINDFIDPVPYNKNEYDLTFYTGLENPKHFYKVMTRGSTTYTISPAVLDDDENHFCNPSFIYSGAALVGRTPMHKPNYQSGYLADLFIGRVDRDYKIGRAWSYYHVLQKQWQDRLIFTARHRSDPTELFHNIKSKSQAQDFIFESFKRFGPIAPDRLPDYDNYEKTVWHSTSLQEGLSPDIIGSQYTQPENLDFFMPDMIYKESLYSIIMTDCNVRYYEEKIARAIIGRRPFIVIGPQGYLAQFKNMGFQTFDPVIDESYDNEPDDHARWTKAFDSLEKLSSQNPQSVYDRLRKRLQHNRKLAYNSEYWITKLKSYLNLIINKHTGQPCVIS